MEFAKRVEFVAHCHMFRYQNGRHLPAEIGVVQVLADGAAAESSRRSLLVTIDNSHRHMTRRDKLVNRVVSERVSKLPYSHHSGGVSVADAERKIADFVGDALVAVKGESQKHYFDGFLTMEVVNLEEMGKAIPKFKELPIEFCQASESAGFHHDLHVDFNDSNCSRAVAWAFSKFIESGGLEAGSIWGDDDVPAKREPELDGWGDLPAEPGLAGWDDDVPAEPKLETWDDVAWDDNVVPAEPKLETWDDVAWDDDVVPAAIEPKLESWDDDVPTKQNEFVLNLDDWKDLVKSLTYYDSNLKIVDTFKTNYL